MIYMQEVMKLLDGKGKLQRQLVTAVAKQGDLPRLQWLYKHGCERHVSLYTTAAEAGNVAMLQWLHSQEPRRLFRQMLTAIVAAAACSNHLAVLQWFHRKPCDGIM